MRPLLLAAALAALLPLQAQAQPPQLDALAASVQGKVQAWRRDLHQHPELGNQETRTAAKVAEHLRSLGLEVRTGIGPTGVSAVLRGAKPGPRIALRADMDALPVTEETGLPFASTVKADYRGTPVGVMHACGHDAHVAILMGVAEALASMRGELSGEAMFVFQPAEEGPPTVGEVYGAARMIKENLFADFKPDAIYGLHVWAALPVGSVGTRTGPVMAAADEWTLRIDGKQTHGSRPWDGVDPITVAAQVHLGWQSILARQVDITRSPVVLTRGAINGGVRFNIVPDRVDMTGTLRTFDPAMRADVIARMGATADGVATASGAKATLRVVNNAPVTANDGTLAPSGLASLRTALGEGKVVEMPLLTIAEDFSQYATVAPTFFWFVGSTAPGVDPLKAPANHSPMFLLDEQALDVGVRTMLQVSLDRLQR
ncbi:amidohydrolase [Arenimonas sp. MALMAid1274]|uniref:amidohydrolase n=1 Tax=Arenimonas sp. MALMAid1274 TaxID=3411630 RepID=UPI003BA38254